MNTNLIERTAYITDRESIYYGEWGIIVDCDEDYYYIAIANGRDSIAAFRRNEFRVRRKEQAHD